MTPLVRLTAIAAPLMRENIDTDAIIPSREMKTVSKTGLADGLFAGWRYSEIDSRTPDPVFILNQPPYDRANVLISGANFGCGSSREHAVWALAEYGFRAVVAPSFSPIFEGNCIRNGVAPIILPLPAVERIAAIVATRPHITIDLETQTVRAGDEEWRFSLGNEPRQMLMQGLDAIELTLQRRPEIATFRAMDSERRPWAYLSGQHGPSA
ncbi:3-isopropylmalate dehydratase small subunit [Sphingobium boeckii]|uniref:3-isopropylmalate dehydratase small subunit n=1 Tax=Sphingobium boeckii TaxID=1082345 RepID=A0A7W9EGA7_9SPHN|nr:3-isopropylmalate/(R)-2-methylmalate dehydratase small subunit [Sphingobium boeckii]